MSIAIQQLDKKFGQFHALKNINLEVKTGQLVALLGPSGCGKTTLLRIIAGLERADSGKIYFDQEEVTHQHVRDRHIGFMFQHYALFKHMSVFENIAFGLRVLPRSQRPSKQEIAHKVRELLQLIQLEWLEKAYPNQLSGGQRQRIALARALAVSPKLLLLDEPFGALDAKVRKELRQWLRHIHHELNITSILVTHDQEEALEIADEIVLMNQGKIEQVGQGEALYSSPKNAFVTEFLGEVNIFDDAIIKNNQLKIGQYIETLGRSDLSDKEEAVVAYVRPHDLCITDKAENSIAIAIIEDIQSIGPITRIFFKAKSYHRLLEAVIPHKVFLQKNYQVGDAVYLYPEKSIIFRLNELVEYMI